MMGSYGQGYSDADIGDIWRWFDDLVKVAGQQSEMIRNVRSLVGAGLFLERKLGQFNVGDRVELQIRPEIGPDSGWRRFKDVLVVGAVATVRSKELIGDRFDNHYYHSYGVSFDKLDQYDDPKPLEEKSVFSFREHWLRRAT